MNLTIEDKDTLVYEPETSYDCYLLGLIAGKNIVPSATHLTQIDHGGTVVKKLGMRKSDLIKYLSGQMDMSNAN